MADAQSILSVLRDEHSMTKLTREVMHCLSPDTRALTRLGPHHICDINAAIFICIAIRK